MDNSSGSLKLTCKICRCSFPSVLSYCEHCKIHKSVKNFKIPCTFPGCQSKLATAKSFKSHLSKCHRPPDPETPSNPPISTLPCPVQTCAVKILSRAHYLSHMVEKHLPSKLKPEGDTFVCVYKDCKSNINAVKQFRTHVARNHLNVEPVGLQSIVEPNLVETVEVGEGFDEDNNDDDNEEEEVNVHFKVSDVATGKEDMDIYPDHVVKDEIGRFYLKLEAELILPTSSVQTIAEEIKLLSELTHYKVRRAMREELLPHLNEADVNNIVRKTLRSDPVFNTHHKGEDPVQFGTNHLGVQFWKKRFRFVEPEQKFLGRTASGKKMYAHYVPVKEALQIMLMDEKVKQEVIKSFDKETRDPDILEDFTDGSFFKNHKFETPGHAKCIQLLLFQDAFDHNAFGSSSGQYKPNGFYYTLGNLPDHLRSKLDLIQAAYMVLDKDLKPTQGEELNDVDRLKLSLQPLIDALIDLQQNGIEFNGEKLPVCVIFLLGDSLGQNFIGGFVRNFSTSEFSCRFCPISKTQFLENPHETKPFRTQEEYNEYAEKAKAKWMQLRRISLKTQKRARESARRRAQRVAARCTAPGKKRNLSLPVSKAAYKRLLSVNYRGVKYRPSPFNRPELGFHVVTAQPPCLAHDLHEGIIKKVVPVVLKHMIDQNWFDLETLNKRIVDFKCKGNDALDRIKPLKSLEKLAGNAVENLNFLILLPFILGSLVRDPDDPFWQTFLLLKEITEYVCAPRIHMQQVAYLRRLIDTFLSKMKLLMPLLLTPKAHYLCHYPDLIALYGPLSKLFTLRFESKHKFFKKILKTCQNFINVTYTMTRKYACRFALDNSSKSLLPDDIVYPDISPLQLSALQENALKDSKVDVTNLAEVKWVTFKGTDYKKDKWMVLGTESISVLKLGKIKKILIDTCSEDIMFVMEERLAKNNYQGIYVIQPEDLGETVKALKELPDYYPLEDYGLEEKRGIALKHSICQTIN